VPSGDQFLFVSAAGDRIDVRFVDPDAAAPERDADADALGEVAAPGGPDVRRLALSPRADARSVAALLGELDEIRGVVEGEDFARVEWDAVELPSQFMENFAWDREALRLFARHYSTGEELPDELYERMLKARHFHTGMFLVRQLEFGLFDFRLHLEYDPARGARPMDVLESVRHEVSVLHPPAWQRFPHAFTHVFAGGYSAGYYSYLWAEVLSADAFEPFEKDGVLDWSAGERFRREILAVGATRPALASFTAFRGREPQPDALLRSYGLI